MRSLRFIAGCAGAGLILSTVAPAGADQWFDNGGGTGTWEDASNWASDVPAEDNNVPGSSGEIAVIRSGFSVNLSSAQTPNELQIGRSSIAFPQTPGVGTLNILPGADLQLLSTSGARIGRAGEASDVAGANVARVIQTGGLFQINSGTNGLRLSQGDSGIVADSYYEISGGSARGGPTNGVMPAPLALGNVNNTYGVAEFHMNGSGVTEARFEDIRMSGSLTAGGGDAILRFSLDNGGVTPLIAEDELQFRGNSTAVGNNILAIDLIGLPAEADIVLIQADRIATNGGHSIETFTDMPDGTSIVRQFGGFEYTWNLLYTDGSNDGILSDAVVLDFVSRTVIPEPAGHALLGLGGLALLRRGRRGA